MNTSIQLFKRALYSAILMLMIVSAANTIIAQTISSVLTTSPSPSPYLSDWSGGKEKITLMITSRSTVPKAVKISARLERGGTLIAATKVSAPIMRTITPGVTTLNGADILQLNSIEFFGTDADASRRTGKLPEGNYRLCMTIAPMSTTSTAPSSSEACASFTLVSAQPIILIAPANGSIIRPNETVIFQWSGDPSKKYLLRIYPASVKDPSQVSSDKTVLFEVAGNSFPWVPENTQAKPQGWFEKYYKESTNSGNDWQWDVKPYGWGGTSSQPNTFRLMPQMTPSEGTVTKTETTHTEYYKGPCDSIKIRIANFQHEIDSINSLLQQISTSSSISNSRISQLKSTSHKMDSLKAHYWKLRNHLLGKGIADPNGPIRTKEFYVADSLHSIYEKLRKLYRDSLYEEEKTARSFGWSYTETRLKNETDMLQHFITALQKECTEYIEELTVQKTQLDDKVTQSRNCIEAMQQLLIKMQQKLQQLQQLPQSKARDEVIASVTAMIAKIQQRIQTAQSSLDKAVQAKKNGDASLLRGLAICVWGEDLERECNYIIKTADSDLKQEAEAKERERQKRLEEEYAKRLEEERIKKEQEILEREKEQMDAVKDHLKNSLEQMIDAIERLGEDSKGVKFLTGLKNAVEKITTIVEFIDFLVNIPQNYINLLQAYAAALNDPNYANIQQLANAFCAYAGITGPDQMALVSQSFHNNLPGIIGKMSAQDRKDMVKTIDQIIAQHNAAKK